jgi:diguanylate cyclase (GGDEF)-like protein
MMGAPAIGVILKHLRWLVLCLACAPALGWTSPLTLTDSQNTTDAWPALTWYTEGEEALSPETALSRLPSFQAPAGARGTLGLQKRPFWLHIPLQVAADSNGHWVLDINHPPLTQLDVYVFANGQRTAESAMGSLRSGNARQLHTLSHAAPLSLQPARSYDVLVRVHTTSAAILPITLQKPTTLLRHALREQMLQGLLLGLACCLLAYSFLQWANLRDAIFLFYALMTAGSVSFSIHFYGVGAQFLWSGNTWVEQHAGGLSALLATMGGFLFISEILHMRQPVARRRQIMRGGAALAALLAVAYALDLYGSRVVAGIVTLLGPAPALMGLPAAWRLARRRDAIGTTLLLAWLVYFISIWVAASIIQGWLPINFWTLHAFQFGSTIDMLLFMHVLGLRAKALQQAALAAHQERDTMRSLAFNDPLTGLPNRRGLQLSLGHALEQATPGAPLAVFLLDLDGFKPINDQHGHDAGDELLIAVTGRLQGHTRHNDVVARLGGDEFVVMAHLSAPDQAEELGQKLLDAFRSPFSIGDGMRVHVGLTIGYAIAPFDGTESAELLKRADAAMYNGKQSGKFCLRRHTPENTPETLAME